MHKIRSFFFAIGLLIFWMTAADGGRLVVATEGDPKVVLPSQQHVFEPIVEGVQTRHAFAIRNAGEKDLLLLDVKADWGCAAVSYPSRIPPGEEGTIAITVNTDGYGGRWLRKEARVYTNDPKRSEFTLTMTGQVERFAEITPARLVLEGRVGEELKQKVTIRPRQAHPFTITHIRTRQKDLLAVRLDHIHKEPPGSFFQITIESIYNQPGRYVDQVHLQTDNENHPEIRLGVILILKPADAKSGM